MIRTVLRKPLSWLVAALLGAGLYFFEPWRLVTNTTVAEPYLELGVLKGNRGDQVYRLDPGVDPAAFRSVSIWCKRFAVSFGAADLA